MLRKLTLMKGAFLWDAGDAARTLAVVESGRLGVRGDKGYLGIVLPKMVFGEAALLSLSGEAQTRTAAVVALEDDTTVTEYVPSMVKSTFDAGQSTVGVHLLMTLIAQACKNDLMVVAAHPRRLATAGLLKSQVQGLTQAIPQIRAIATWDEFYWTFRFLFQIRSFSDTMRETLVGEIPADSPVLAQASEMAQELFKGTDIATYLEDFMAAEREKLQWLEPERRR